MNLYKKIIKKIEYIVFLKFIIKPIMKFITKFIENYKYSKINDKKFKNYKIRTNSILIVEPNEYHLEIIIGFVKYFQDLGYNIDLFLRHKNSEPFILKNLNKVECFYGTAEHLKKLLKLNKIKQYEYVFFSSSAYWETNINFSSYLDYLKFIPKAKNGILMVEHNVIPYLKEYNEEKYLKENRLFTLSGFQNTPILNPHYFGDIKTTPKSKEKTKFITVGAINNDCKNHDLLISSIKELAKENITNFEVIIIGGGNVLEITKEIEPYVKYLGKQPFSVMFEEMEEADYFLPLLDLSIEKQLRYLNSTTTGSKQLILGFLKPCLINDEFGKVYGFNNDNSFLYQDNNLKEAMKQAISLNNDDYLIMQNNLKILADKIYQKSLSNLKISLKRIENE